MNGTSLLLKGKSKEKGFSISDINNIDESMRDILQKRNSNFQKACRNVKINDEMSLTFWSA